MQAITGIDVVVNAGRGAVEGLMAGRRVACVNLSLPDHALGEAVSSENFARLKHGNFVGAGPALDAQIVWESLSAMTERQVRQVRDSARSQLSQKALRDTHLKLIGSLSAPQDLSNPFIDATIWQNIKTEEAFWKAKNFADKLWREKHPSPKAAGA